MNDVCLFEESFSSFSLGAFPYDADHSAMGEYHFFPEVGYKGRWHDPIANYNYKGPSWLITSPFLDDRKIMESSRIQEPQEKTTLPTLVTGDVLWQDYQATVSLRPLSKDLQSGFLFRYQTSLMHYGIFFTSEGLELQRVDKLERKVLAKASLVWSTDEFHQVTVAVSGEMIVVSLAGEEVLRAQDGRYSHGCVALCACMPTQYASIEVFSNKAEATRLAAQKAHIQTQVTAKRKVFPQPKLVKQIDLADFGAGRQMRFGHLLGTEELYFVVAQNQRRVYKDRYPFISCLTAVSLETGKVLWQKGQPRDEGDVVQLTTDLPFQVYDIDGDGIDEVIASWNFKLYILDGRTGEVKQEMDAPYNEHPADELCGVEFGHHAFERLNIDAISIVNVTGKDRPSDLLIKDRYARIWIYDNQLQLVWMFTHNNTGHFPYAHDFNGDGKDEIFSCYNMIGSDGKLLWKLPINTDHTDEIIIGPIDPDQEDLIAMVSGWEGFMLIDKHGTILRRDINGHGQRISVGNYLPANRGLEICTTTYWGSQGIVYMHDCKGKELWHREMRFNGNIIAPVNWDGSGQDLILLNANVQHGGLMDGDGDIVVRFPEDGHPDLCCEVLNITGDERDEIIVWDRKRLWVYTQDTEQPKRDKTYLPYKYPMYNASNYRGEFCFPRFV